MVIFYYVACVVELRIIHVHVEIYISSQNNCIMGHKDAHAHTITMSQPLDIIISKWLETESGVGYLHFL